MQTGEGNKKFDTFPSQELPCSGSTGLISAVSYKPTAPRGRNRLVSMRQK
jgi:hypothetical protein